MIYIIGDSHVSVFSGTDKRNDGVSRHIQPEFGTCYTVLKGQLREHINKFEQKIPYFCPIKVGSYTAHNSFNRLPIIEQAIQEYNVKKTDYVFLCFGEIDIRHHIRINSIKNEEPVETTINRCVDRYMETILFLKNKNINIGVYAPPASSVGSNNSYEYGDVIIRNKITKTFNSCLKEKCQTHNIVVKDISEKMMMSDGTTNTKYIMDDIHLSQEAMPLIMKEFEDVITSNNMISVSLFDNSFSHAFSRGNGDLKILPKHVKFDRHNIHNTIFYTDDHIVSNHAEKYQGHNNVAWLVESKAIRNEIYQSIIDNHNNYNYILTHDLDIINTLKSKNHQNVLWCPAGGCWIETVDHKIYKKTKKLSIIASDKRATYGHKLRHDIIQKYNHLFDGIYGRGYNPIENKICGLQDYMFSLTIENENGKDCFTEKLIDCFVTGTIPIYYGTADIGKYFDTNGMIQIETIDDFEKIIPSITSDFYDANTQSIQKNFELAQNYINTEDWIYTNYPHIFI